MPEKLDRCVKDVKGQGKSEDSAWAICNDSVKEEVANAIGTAGVKEHHNPLDIPFGYEVKEDLQKINKISENVLKQILETQLPKCGCKNKR